MSLWRARTHEIRSRYIGRVVNHHCLPIPPMRSEIEARHAARQNRPDPIRPADVTRRGTIRAWRAE